MLLHIIHIRTSFLFSLQQTNTGFLGCAFFAFFLPHKVSIYIKPVWPKWPKWPTWLIFKSDWLLFEMEINVENPWRCWHCFFFAKKCPEWHFCQFWGQKILSAWTAPLYSKQAVQKRKKKQTPVFPVFWVFFWRKTDNGLEKIFWLGVLLGFSHRPWHAWGYVLGHLWKFSPFLVWRYSGWDRTGW